ncbi:hypothetical protein MJO28_008782 [Puccinia striiformis f. sp. tritici]|uniref:Uncharacterized protein n=1 Tax=Puccinia striiformis f. sp. tritici TaxID=168172 RepID=A0ACC0ED65_9BASI|nr:hypothetical protein Pst134EB_016302 [Puccinia striiformis f. sp. tritici]KAI7949961.1 hypothetical protein MJO28_008782 [Puccinia striiformis f. sp. tritici]KAI7953028.1 hypothetical protein MJO29_008659 [Puccinia striiformis f. sp. tritici]KAI9609817.1 hypothetical protein KEM48_002682 [Puccinia striiformis f. sp. tritici PST-130]
MTTSITEKTGSITEKRREDSEDHEVDDDDLLAQLDDNFELSGLRERRLEELRKEVSKSQEMSEDNHGRYVEVKQEKKLIQITAKAKTSVVHFFHPDFERCKTMDKKLEELSFKYFATRFLRVDVANVPWLVEKLQVKVLPCVVGFLDGVSKDRIVGFEGITGETSKEINSSALELRLKQAGLLKDEATMGAAQAHQRSVFSSGIRQGSDGDSDWDD